MTLEHVDIMHGAVVDVLRDGRLVPVIVLEDVAGAHPLAGALLAGGLRCAEVTFRTSAAEQAIAAMSRTRDLVVGAGTILTAEQVDRAVAAGAQFIVTPGFSASVVRHCLERSIPVFPGVATATEIQMALDEGLSVLKFFPAEALGGLAMLKALAAPFRNVRFIPTGGLSADLVSDYLAHPSVLAVAGSWMVGQDLLERGDWREVTRLTAEAVSLAQQATA